MENNNSKIRKVFVNQETSNYIEGLGYEADSRRNIITFMLERNMDTTTKAFRKYQSEYTQYITQFEIAKQELEKTYTPEEWKGHECKWNLDYHTCAMTIEKQCNC